jgi:hypothetical protein
MMNIPQKILVLTTSLALFHTHETIAFLSFPNVRQPRHGRTNSITISSPESSLSSLLLFSMDFKQQPGESDIAFIKRITTSSNNAIPPKQPIQSSLARHKSAGNVTQTDNNNNPTRGVYQRIEEWDEERTTNGQLTWEEKVQFDGQRFGNQVHQDHILRHHIGTFF